MLTCKETSGLISARYDRPLGTWERVSVSLHLLMCRYCRAVARQIAVIQKLVRLPGSDPSLASNACLSAEVRARMSATLTKADRAKTPGATAD